tara:strand:+ start:1135 stop:1569 length:435 start_codon:yes stop_codon:yes gene_type:complete
MALIRHVGVVITDIDKSLDFYVNMLGFRVSKRANESGKCIDNFLNLEHTEVTTIKMSDDNGNILELLHFSSHPDKSDNNKVRFLNEIGCSHFALTVDNLDELYLSLNNKDIKFNYPPQVSDDGKVKVAFCRDPDGTFIEMVEEL